MVGANCRRYVTADAMGMAKERGRLEGETCRCCRNRVEHKHGERHHDVPRFGALRRYNTPTPACLLYISEISNYNNCSWSCIRGRRDRPWAWLSPASLCVVMAGSKCEGCRPSRRRGILGSYSVSSGYYGNFTCRLAPAVGL